MFSGIFKKPSSQNENKRKSQMSLMTLKNQSQDPWDREDRPDLVYDRLYSSQVSKIMKLIRAFSLSLHAVGILSFKGSIKINMNFRISPKSFRSEYGKPILNVLPRAGPLA